MASPPPSGSHLVPGDRSAPQPVVLVEQGSDGVVSLAPLWRLIRRYRRVLAVGVLLSLAAYAAGAVSLRFSTAIPAAAVRLRFVFEGVEKGKYPNGLAFSADDLLAAPVLEHVYEQDGVAKFATFDRFRGALWVAPVNLALLALEAEYTAKLRDPKLSVAERRSLETDYRDRLEALRTITWTLAYEPANGAVLPPALTEKVLLDVPRAWAEYSVEKRHVLEYAIDIASAQVPNTTRWEFTEVLVAAETLRSTMQALLDSARRVGQLPGASLLRDGQGRSLDDLAREIDAYTEVAGRPTYLDLLALAYGLSPAGFNANFETRADSAQRELQLAELGERASREGFERYAAWSAGATGTSAGTGQESATQAAVAPRPGQMQAPFIAQLGEGFIDQLLRLGDREVDTAYRQALNDRITTAKGEVAEKASELDFLRTTHSRLQRAAQIDDAAAGTTTDRTRKAMEAYVRFSARLAEFYRAASEASLNPGTQLYRIDGPVARWTDSMVSLTRAGMGAAAVAVLATLLLLGACAAYDARPRRSGRGGD